jgi:hypothetical protein
VAILVQERFRAFTFADFVPVFGSDSFDLLGLLEDLQISVTPQKTNYLDVLFA